MSTVDAAARLRSVPQDVHDSRRIESNDWFAVDRHDTGFAIDERRQIHGFACERCELQLLHVQPVKLAKSSDRLFRFECIERSAAT